MVDFRKDYAIGSIRDVSNYITDDKKYATQVCYQKSVESGREIVKGAFYSVGKDRIKDNISKVDIDDRIYYTNNQIDPLDNLEPTQSNLLPYLEFALILLVILFIVADFAKYYRYVQKENSIEREHCLKDYKANDCDNVTAKDGPIINEYCKNKQKCINIHYDNVFFHRIVVQYSKDFLSNCFSSLSYLTTFLFIFASFLFLKVAIGMRT